MALIKFKRGTRAQLDAAATANELNQGEPYFITDGSVVAVGSAVDSAIDLAKSSDLTTHTGSTTAHGISTFGASLVDDTDAATARSTLGLGTAATTDSTAYEPADSTILKDADKATGFDDSTTGRIVTVDHNADDLFNIICKIAGMAPTLYLNAKEQDYRIYSPVTGLTRKALADIVTTTRASDGAIWTPTGKLTQLTSNTPRVTFDPETGVGEGLLVEESRTNLLPHTTSPYATWSNKTTVTVTAGVEGPDGSTNAFTITANGGLAVLGHTVSGQTLGDAFTGGFWVRRRTGTGDINMAVGSSLYNVLVASSEWSYAELTRELGDSYARLFIRLVASGDAIDVCYPNLQKGSFITSHIPTAGTAATRAADVIKIDGTAFSDLWSQNEVSVLIWWDKIGDYRNQETMLIVSSGSLDNYHRIIVNSANDLYFQNIKLIDSVQDIPSCNIAYAIDSADTSISMNGAYVNTVNPASLAATQINIGTNFDGSRAASATYNHLIIFPKRLPNATLQQLSALVI